MGCPWVGNGQYCEHGCPYNMELCFYQVLPPSIQEWFDAVWNQPEALHLCNWRYNNVYHACNSPSSSNWIAWHYQAAKLWHCMCTSDVSLSTVCYQLILTSEQSLSGKGIFNTSMRQCSPKQQPLENKMTKTSNIMESVIKRDLCCWFCSINFSEEGTICIMLLLLDCGAKSQERFRYFLLRCLQNINQAVKA